MPANSGQVRELLVRLLGCGAGARLNGGGLFQPNYRGRLMMKRQILSSRMFSALS